MDYKTHSILNETSYFSCLLTPLGAFAPNESLPYLIPIFLLTNSYYIFSRLFNTEIYLKDIKEIRSLYDEFLYNYVKLNKKLNLDNPVEIWHLFRIFVYENYLANSTHQNALIYHDVKSLEGAHIISGYFTRKNYAIMLNEIFNELGYDTNILGIVHTNFVIKKNKIERRVNLPSKKNIIGIKKANNHIVAIDYNENNYLFSPISDTRFDYGDNKLRSDFESNIKIVNKRNFNTKLNTLTPFDYFKVLTKAQEKIISSIDEIEEFYKKKRVLYYEISKKIELIRQKK